MNDWKDEKGMLSDFDIESVCGTVLFASYGAENYSGEAWVLFENNGALFEVNGAHCSCYGLEGQWEPEMVTLEVIEYRITNGTFGINDWSGNTFREKLCEFLGVGIEVQE